MIGTFSDGTLSDGMFSDGDVLYGYLVGDGGVAQLPLQAAALCAHVGRVLVLFARGHLAPRLPVDLHIVDVDRGHRIHSV